MGKKRRATDQHGTQERVRLHVEALQVPWKGSLAKIVSRDPDRRLDSYHTTPTDVYSGVLRSRSLSSQLLAHRSVETTQLTRIYTLLHLGSFPFFSFTSSSLSQLASPTRTTESNERAVHGIAQLTAGPYRRRNIMIYVSPQIIDDR